MASAEDVIVQATMTCRACPVQIEGTINGKPFYFRSRWGHWEMTITEEGVDPVEGSMGRQSTIFYRRQEVDPEGFSAGWMPEDEAMRLVKQCATDFVTGNAQ